MIIMLTGKAGCGKDTAYKIMKKYANKSIKRYAFADPLKNIAYGAGWDGIKDEKGRKLLVSLGKAINQYQKNFFVFETANAITEDKDISTKVITDFRLPCEYKAIREWFPSCERIVLIKIFGRASEYGRTTNDITERLDVDSNHNDLVNIKGAIDNGVKNVNGVVNSGVSTITSSLNTISNKLDNLNKINNKLDNLNIKSQLIIDDLHTANDYLRDANDYLKTIASK